jgi:hypothetical protein
MAETDWHRYGTGKNPKCNNCMAHCGYEGTAVEHTLTNPLTALKVFLFGPKVSGAMAPELPYVEAPGPADEAGAETVEIPLNQISQPGLLDEG